ncbi:hypothetical protein LEP1GSC058_1493 [Leptospira fainei serovar Hurstbridge str. BUT 6]|uniref:Uncharacterized protein n=1 Tax=Leptospira fainei serovar Hurstbridge str. BUT 6 TaxID=1193011 RepID=S3UX39_9LEPT|nr:hypothetical protein LEP1GSC058_1493 [Leptospira fainei serovar Hurstbridge str. BUT 6]
MFPTLDLSSLVFCSPKREGFRGFYLYYSIFTNSAGSMGGS